MSISQKQTSVIVLVLLCINPIIGMAVDLVSPSLPAITLSLNISAKVAKDVISVYLLGYALGNFSMGFLTDALGRQTLIRIWIVIFVLVSLIPVFSPNIEMLLLARFLQGITLGGIAVLVRAICTDILPPEKLVNMGVIFAMVWGIGPIIGPLIGGYLQAYFGWQAGFVFFAVMMSLVGMVVFGVVPETHFNRHAFNLPTMKKNLTEVLSNRVFVSLVMLMGLTYSLLIIFNTLGPFLIQTRYHYSPVYFGRLALILGFVFLLSTMVCRFFLKFVNMEKLLLIIVNLFFAFSIVLLCIGYLFPNSIFLLALASAIMFFGAAFVFPLSMGKGMGIFRHISGTSNATMYLINVLITSLCAFLASFLVVQNILTLLWIYVFLMLFCMLIYWKLIHNKLT